MMKLTILGSGTAYPKQTKGSAGYLLTVEDQHMLFDTGLGTLYKLEKLDIDLRNIKHIFYSHTHVDHICELAPLLWYLNVFAKQHSDDALNKKAHLTLYGPAGFKKYYDSLTKNILGWDEPAPFIKEVIELSSSDITIDDIKIHTAPVSHMIDTICFRVEHDKKIFVYSGDTGPCDGINKLAKDADLLLVECGFPKSKPVEKHMTTTDCGRLAKHAEAKKLILTHLYPAALRVDAKAEAAEEFDGEIIIAEDLMDIMI